MDENVLVLRERFEKVLHDYQISEAGRLLLNNLKLLLLAGPSGSGRNTVMERLIKSGAYHKIVSDTTRKPRINDGKKEVNGETYWFRSEQEILSDLQNGEFLEAEIIHDQQVSGISLRELAVAKKAHKIAVTDIEIGGFNNIISHKPDTIGVIMLPPSFEVWLKRLSIRGDMPEAELLNRLRTGQRIFREAVSESPARIVINDDIEQAVNEVNGIALGKNKRDNPKGLSVARKLLERTEAFLAANG